MSRRSGGRRQSRTMLILTEGPSEVEYFNMFRGMNREVAVVPIVAKRHGPANLVPYCATKADERGIGLGNGDSVSIVIDVDDCTSEELLGIERQCADKGFDLYLSNRSFECWLIMHFHMLTRPMSQDELERELSDCMRSRYRKSEGICKKITMKDVDTAIINACRTVSDREKRNKICINLNPSTTVHFLVESVRNPIPEMAGDRSYGS